MNEYWIRPQRYIKVLQLIWIALALQIASPWLLAQQSTKQVLCSAHNNIVTENNCSTCEQALVTASDCIGQNNFISSNAPKVTTKLTVNPQNPLLQINNKDPPFIS